MQRHLERIKNAVLDGDFERIEGLIRSALEEGLGAEAIIEEALVPAMDVVGERFSTGKIFVPEMLVAAMVMKSGLEIVQPLLKIDDIKKQSTVVIGTVKGDLHDIGKNIVAIMLDSAGFKVIDLGVDVETARFVDAANHSSAGIVAISALLTVTVPVMAETVAAVRQSCAGAKIMVGGAPVTEEMAMNLGADAYGADAASAVQIARRLVGIR
jgi:5-methyltetrahydrofolate--homocysteine methyltransferase